ncbi:MAG: OmpA family protein [Gammaproteobacteria bacterium]
MLKKHLLALVALTIVGFLPTAQADKVVDDRFYVAPFGTFIQPGGDRGSNSGWGGGMGFGKMLDEHFNIELKGFYQSMSGGNQTGSWNLAGGSADVQYYIMRDKFSPYTVIGLGGMNSSHNGDSGAGFIGEAGAGATYEVSDNFLIRGDVRYRYNQNFNANLQPGTNEFHDMVVNVGFVVPFGPKPVAPVVVAEAPAPTPVAAPDCSTMDDDHDGVNNCDDWCPNTPPAVDVSIKGCWIIDVKFANDSAVIPPEYYANLDNAAEALKKPEIHDMSIEIQGHTSKTGGFKYNMALSERRAEAVKKYLIDGNDFPNLTTRGYGWTQPIDTNDTEAGRANNRRVQIQVNGEPQQPLIPQLDPLNPKLDPQGPQ